VPESTPFLLESTPFAPDSTPLVPESTPFVSESAQVTRLLKEAYVRVTSLLKEKEAELHKLAAALLDKETLNGQEIKEVPTPPDVWFTLHHFTSRESTPKAKLF
jgi:hypothetical protein